MEARRTHWGVQSSNGGERSRKAFFKCFAFTYGVLIEVRHKSLGVALIKKSKNHLTNKKCTFIFYAPIPFINHFLSSSLSSPCFRASSFIIRTTVWEAIREKLTQLPASLSRLQPHQAGPLPCWYRDARPLRSEADWCAVKYLLTFHLAPWELCTNSLTHSQTHLHAGNSQTKTIKWWSWSGIALPPTSDHIFLYVCRVRTASLKIMI